MSGVERPKQLFLLKAIILHIDLKELKCTTTSNNFVLKLTLDAWDGAKRSKQIFSVRNHVAY